MAILSSYVNARVNPWGESGDEVVSALITHGEVYQAIKVPNAVDSVLGKYVIELPEVPDLTNGRTVTLYDLGTNGQATPTAMTQKTTVTQMNAATTRSFMLAPTTSSRPHLVWVTNDMKNHYIGFSYYGKGQVLSADNLKDFICNTLKVQSGANIPQISGNIVVNGQMNCNSLVTPSANISDLYSSDGTVTINGKLKSLDTLTVSDAVIIGGITIGGKLDCAATLSYYYNETVFTLSTQFPSFPTVDWNKYDPDKTLINVMAYTWDDDSPDQDEVFDMYYGPLRYFITHAQEIPRPTIRKQVGTHLRICYYMTELS